ncbi:hypothetical protein MRX96_054796 [Rhipicephalus microplus]
MLDKIDGVLASEDLTEVTEGVNKVLSSLGSAQTVCVPPSCPQDVKDKLGSVETDLKQLQGNTEVEVSPKFVNLTKTMKVVKGLEKKLERFGGRLNKSVGQLEDSLKDVLEKLRKASASADHPSEEVNSVMGMYAVLVTLFTGVITVVVGIYLFGNQCLISRASTGCCSFNTASWAMVVAVLAFLISFPILVVASRFGTTAGLSIDRKVCAPAMDLGTHVSLVAGARRREGGASSSSSMSWRLSTTSGRGTRWLKRVASPKNRRDRSKRRRVPARAYKWHERAQRFETPEHKKAARRRRGQKPRGDDHEGDDVGSFVPPADIASVLWKELTPKALEGVVERFAQCSHTGLSYFKLLSKDLMTDMARAYLGPKSPWLGLIDDSAGAPKLDVLERMDTKFPSVLNDLAKTLSDISPATAIDGKEFETISTKAESAKEDFRKFGDMKKKLQGYVNNAGPDVTYRAARNLTKDFMIGNKPVGIYIADNLPNWNVMKSGIADSKKEVLQMGEKVKAAFNSDLALFFDPSKNR